VPLKLKPSEKIYERDARNKMTNKWKWHHHTPSSTKTKELIKMHSDIKFRRKKEIIRLELKKRGVTV
jgi:hypothetical protein